MTRFVTLDHPTAPHRVLVWEEGEEGRPRVVGRHKTLAEVGDADCLEVWRFEAILSTGMLGPVNEGRHPVVDVDGAPLWDGASVAFRVPTHYVNWTEGHGTYRKTDLYGGSYVISDVPMPVRGRNGETVDVRREQYFAVSDFRDRNAPLAGYRVLTRGLGDGLEHGRTEMFIRLDDDPRRICTLVSSPAPAPAP